MKKFKTFFSGRSLFAKTWLISVASICLTTGLLFLIILIFADSLIYDAQKKTFEEKAERIFEAIQTDNQEKMDEYITQGFTFQIDDAVVTKSGIITENSEVDEAVAPEEDLPTVWTNTEVLLDPEKSFHKKKTLVKDGESRQIVVYYPIALKQNEIFDLIRNVSPYFILITLVVSSLIGFIYAKYFSNQIKSINQMVGEMALETYPETDTNVPGDELQVLRNDIRKMYNKLRQTMRALQKEINLVKNLQDSRQLFMSGIVHELKTPIMNMMLPLKESYVNSADEANSEHLRSQLDYLTGMNKLVSELLELSRVDEESLNETNLLAPILTDVIDVYKEMLEDKEQSIHLTLEQSAQVTIPKKKMQKLISNLLGNAIKYSPEKSVIDIEVTDAVFTIENECLDETALSTTELHKPFVSTDSEVEYPSHGLGLYLVQAMLQFYNYRYSCWTEKNRFCYRIFLK